MPFGAIFGALFFGLFGVWLWLAERPPTADSIWPTIFLTGVAWSVAAGLLVRRRWARWSGLLLGLLVVAGLPLQPAVFEAGAAPLLFVLSGLATVALLLHPRTGGMRTEGQPRPVAPRLGRGLACIGVLGALGFLGASWVSRGPAAVHGAAASASEGRALQASAPRPVVPTWSDFGRGLQLARQTDRPMIVSFETDWCGYCTKMRQTTWKDPDVRRRLAQLVPVRVDAEDSTDRNGFTGRDLAARYGVSGYPTLMLVDGRGQVMSRAGGYQTPRQLLAWLDGALSRTGGGPLQVSAP